MADGGLFSPAAEFEYRMFPWHSEVKFSIDEYIACQPVSDSSVFSAPDHTFLQNRSFTYPVLFPKGVSKARSAVLMLHGLNERNWIKYLPWAEYLVNKLNRPVILFPIAFHINRSPAWWGNPRKLMEYMDSNSSASDTGHGSTLANIALSERLKHAPLRFFTSGKQSADDIIDLVQTIHRGGHPLFEQGTQVDFFAYSIGAFLAQVLFIANPEGIFDNSRLFLFCGGAFFYQMNGVSRVIMDKPAFETLHKYYLHDIRKDCTRIPGLSACLRNTQLGMAFSSMIKPSNLPNYREHALRQMNERVSVVAMQDDHVIPAEGTMEALGFLDNVKVLDFPYPCQHENPFPVNNHELMHRVDSTFSQVFGMATDFLR